MKSIFGKYDYYRTYLERLARIPFTVDPIARGDKDSKYNLKMSSAAMQMAHREMKEMRFKGSTVDYLAWVGGKLMMDLWGEFVIEPGALEKTIAEVISHRLDDGIVMLRSSQLMRVVDLYKLPINAIQRERQLNTILVLDRLYNMVIGVQTGEEKSLIEMKEKGLENLIRRILEYQSVAPDAITSLESPQTINQTASPRPEPTETPNPSQQINTPSTPKAPSRAKGEAKRQAARRGPRPKTPGHQPQ